jgi:DNA topoisomerase VI subunit B
MMASLERTLFSTGRAAEYFTVSELQAQTGQPRERFAAVVVKELVDNALDAAETAGVAPEVTIGVERDQTELRLAVQDNGPGLAPTTVERILDFSTRTSDKAAYRAPTRGAQGNALKTVLGIPVALGSTAPVTIASQQVRHQIHAAIDPAGHVRIGHDTDFCSIELGTRVAVVLPNAGQTLDPVLWARGFSLFNPHALVNITSSVASASDNEHAYNHLPETDDSYHPTAGFPGSWRKFLPTDLTSPHWYDRDAFQRLVFSHIAVERQGGADRLLRDFVREFRGLSGSAKAKAVCAHLPTIRRLSDFAADEAAVPRLLETMQHEAIAPRPGVLGRIGRDHFRHQFTRWYGLPDAERFWYRSAESAVEGIPFIVEVALAETAIPAEPQWGINFSPTFDDPLAGTRLAAPDGTIVAEGWGGFLRQAHVLPEGVWDDTAATATAAAIHLVCPALTFLDRAKTRLAIPEAMAAAIGDVLWQAAKPLYREGEQRKRDAARAERSALQRHRTATVDMKEAVFLVLSKGWELASGNGEFPVNVRNVFYRVRDLIQAYTPKELDYTYFSQTLIVEYQRCHGPLPNLYADPRGVLYEPHTGHSIPLGTREVDDYAFPAHLYDKILYIEKKGLWPILERARLAERYDLAVVAAEGYATEAVRTLFARAERDRAYRLFVLHDADPHGYNIARTLREATARMPEHAVEVIDLGLSWDQAQALGLQPETFTRRKALPSGLELNERERQAFTGRLTWTGAGRQAWIGERVELNALSAPQLVAHLEAGLSGAGATAKVVPDQPTLRIQTEAVTRAALRSVLEEEFATFIGMDILEQDLYDATAAPILAELTPASVTEHLEDHREWSWTDIVTRSVTNHLVAARPSLCIALRDAVRERVTNEGMP